MEPYCGVKIYAIEISIVDFIHYNQCMHLLFTATAKGKLKEEVAPS
jgi:hypothetical protein